MTEREKRKPMTGYTARKAIKRWMRMQFVQGRSNSPYGLAKRAVEAGICRPEDGPLLAAFEVMGLCRW